MTAPVLKPCPFCGGEAGIRKWQDEDLWSRAIVGWQKAHCTECECEGISSCHGYDPDTVQAWNTRAAQWQPIAEAPQDGTRLMLWDSVSKRPVFGSWRGDNPAITHYAAEPAGPGVS